MFFNLLIIFQYSCISGEKKFLKFSNNFGSEINFITSSILFILGSLLSNNFSSWINCSIFSWISKIFEFILISHSFFIVPISFIDDSTSIVDLIDCISERIFKCSR